MSVFENGKIPPKTKGKSFSGKVKPPKEKERVVGDSLPSKKRKVKP